MALIDCSECGARISSAAVSCPSCGSKKHVTTNPSLFTCRECGAEISPTVESCPVCGCPKESPASVAQKNSVTDTVPCAKQPTEKNNEVGAARHVVGGVVLIALILFGIGKLASESVQIGGVFPTSVERTVDTWLDQDIAGRALYEVPGVSEYVLVAHKILKSSNGIVTAELTFKNQRNGDVVSTHTFRVNAKGRVEMLR